MPIDPDTKIWTLRAPRGLRERAQPILLELFRGVGLTDAEATAARIAEELAHDFGGQIKVEIPDIGWANALDKNQVFNLTLWGKTLVAEAWRELIKLACLQAVRAELRRRGIEPPPPIGV